MPLGILFWVVYIIALLVGLWGWYEPAAPNWRQRVGGYVTLWLLVGVLGWEVFGPAVRR